MRLLIDGDILAYKACSSAETAVDWGDGLWTLHVWEDEVKAKVRDELSTLQRHLGVEDFVITLTGKGNFRKQVVDETYKSNRSATRKPMLLPMVREWLVSDYGALIWENLEADDVMGILATRNPKDIIVSEDKDMRTIPCQLWNHKEQRVEIITKDEADYNFMTQTLTGDVTDGYGGCPRIGPKTAEKLLTTQEPRTLEWMWRQVVKAYEKAGLSEEYAVRQAWLARILRNEDYDDGVLLWKAPDISGHY